MLSRPALQAVLPGGATVGPTPPNQGLLPALFGFQLGPGQGYVEALTPEQQHQVVKGGTRACREQRAAAAGTRANSPRLPPPPCAQAFLSRLLLMLGSFVIMCLLLF